MGVDGNASLTRRKRVGGARLAAPPQDEHTALLAANGLLLHNSGQSAHVAVTPRQARMVGRLFLTFGLMGLLWPEVLLIALGAVGSVLFAAILLWRVALVWRGVAQMGGTVAQNGNCAADEGLPTYTLLIALYDEAETARQLATAIRGLDYPQHKLDLKLLIEAGDDVTEAALRAERWPVQTELLVLPNGTPRTKPRALNFGLARARGEFVVVYDAEDRPDARQLREAVAAFQGAPKGLACVQAPLVGQGGTQSWTAGQWALEYAIQFGILLPALASWNMPIALGGTSNHFRRNVLEAVGGWDAWNVTEDADLGLRLARQGYRVGMISAPTLEAPPAKISIWMPQRSRWLKGFLQTWLVIMRHPRQAAREMGGLAFASMQLTLGATLLSAIAHGPWLFWCLLCFASPHVSLGWLGTVFFVLTYTLGLTTALIAPGGLTWRRLVLSMTLPLYWPLQSLAMMRALYGLYTCPHFWAKTPHEAVATTGQPECLIGPSPLPGFVHASSLSSLPTGVRQSHETTLPA